MHHDCPKFCLLYCRIFITGDGVLGSKVHACFRLNVLLFCYGKNRILNSEDNPYSASHTFTVCQSKILRRD